MTFGKRLKRIREQKGVSQNKLAELIGVSQTIISSYECDKSKPKFEHIVPIAKSLDVSPNELFGVSRAMDNEWMMKFLCTTRDRLINSNNLIERSIASNYSFIIRELENEEKRIKKSKNS